MSIKSAIDKLTGKSSKNIEDAISKIELGGKPAPKTTTLFDQTLTFAISEDFSNMNAAYVAPFDPTPWGSHVNDDISFIVDNKEYTKVTIETGEGIIVTVADDSDNSVAQCLIGPGIIPGVSDVTFAVALFNEAEGDHHIVVKATEKEGETSNLFLISLTRASISSPFVADKSYSDILLAFRAGKSIFIQVGSQYIPLSHHMEILESDEHFDFTHIDYAGSGNATLEVFYIWATNTVSYYSIVLATNSQS